MKTEFIEVADTFGISHPAIVEKDYYVVQLLKILEAVKIPGYELVFSGGTCLEKVHHIIFRMSEDIDIKLIEEADIANLSRTKKKSLLRNAYNHVLTSLKALGASSHRLDLSLRKLVLKGPSFLTLTFRV